jgi:hypothetical protein
MEKNCKLKRLCTQCAYFVPKEKTCRVNPKSCKGRNANACKSWKYKNRLDGKFVCTEKYAGFVINAEKCENCIIRCVRSESRKEQDYAIQKKRD